MNLDRLSDRLQAALRAAEAYANDLGHGRILPAHLLVALLADRDGTVRKILGEIGADSGRLEKRVHTELTRLRIPKRAEIGWDPSLESILKDAERQAAREDDSVTRTHHALAAIADGGPGAGRRALKEAGVTRSGIRFALRQIGDVRDEEGKGGGSFSAPSGTPSKPTTRAPRGSASARKSKRAPKSADKDGESMLEKFGRDLTALAKSGELDPIVGRDTEIRRLMQILGRRTKNNPVLIGEAGVGKTAVVEGFAYRLNSHDVPFNLKNKRLIEIDLGALVAGTTLRGQFEERVKKLVNEVTEAKGTVILYIDEIHSLVDAGGRGGSGGAADMLKPALARGEVTLIGTTTPAEYRKHIEPDKALERRF